MVGEKKSPGISNTKHGVVLLPHNKSLPASKVNTEERRMERRKGDRLLMMWVDPQLCLNYSWAFWLWELISSLPCLGEFELNLCHLQPQESWLKQRHKQNHKSRTWNLFSAQQKTKYATFDNDVISLPSIGFSSYPGKKATIHT